MNKRELAQLVKEWAYIPTEKRQRLAKAVEEYHRLAAENLWLGYKEQAQIGLESLQKYNIENKDTLNEMAQRQQFPLASEIGKWLEAKPQERKRLETLMEKEYFPQTRPQLRPRRDALDRLLAACLRQDTSDSEIRYRLLEDVAEYLHKEDAKVKQRTVHLSELPVAAYRPPATERPGAQIPGEEAIRQQVRQILDRLDKTG